MWSLVSIKQCVHNTHPCVERGKHAGVMQLTRDLPTIIFFCNQDPVCVVATFKLAKVVNKMLG